MAAVEARRVAAEGRGCPAHAWDKTRTRLAFSDGSPEAKVAGWPGPPGAAGAAGAVELGEHEQTVAAVDWAPGTGLLVTCAHDRNVYVWREDAGTGRWAPEMVLLPGAMDRALLCARWAPKENKFAAGGGAKAVSVSFYEAAENWWTSKLIRKRHGAAVTAMAWHPNNALLATACMDAKCRVLNAFVDKVDAAEDRPACVAAAKFGAVLLEVDCGAWVHAVAWAPAGRALAFAAHNSTLHVLEFAGPGLAAGPDADGGGGTDADAGAAALFPSSRHAVKFAQLPPKALLFLSDTQVVAGGFEASLMLFERGAAGGGGGGGQWGVRAERLEPGPPAAAAATSNAFAAGLAKFGGAAKPSAAAKSAGPHHGCVTCIRAMEADAATGHVARFSTSGLDGRLCVWGATDVAAALAQLRV